jgi:hypothetical protein
MRKPLLKVQSDNAILILCMSIAFVFWIFNKLSQNFTDNATFKLEYNLIDGYCFSEMPQNQINTKISVPGWSLIDKAKISIPVYLNQDSVQIITGDQFQDLIAKKLNISLDKVKVPFQNMQFKIEKLYQKELIVRVPYNFTYEQGYGMAEKVQVIPAKITVKGPRYYLDSLDYFETDTIVLKDLKKNAEVKIQLKDNPLLKFNIKELKAVIKIDQFTEKSLFIPIQFKNAKNNLTLFPNKAKVTCGISLGNYNKLNTSQFVISVDMKNAAKAINKSIPIIIDKYPDFVKNVAISPKAVQIIIQ